MNSFVLDVQMGVPTQRIATIPAKRSWLDRLFGRRQESQEVILNTHSVALQPTQSAAPPTRAQEKMARFLPDPSLSGSALDEYMAKAKKLGVAPTGLTIAAEEQRLLAILRDKNIPVYSARQVHEHMRLVARKAGFSRYVWRPLRKSDLVPGCRFQHIDGWHGDGRILKGVYKHVIPVSVLETVSTIAEADDKVRFFVTDYAHSRPDPFLACTKPGLPFFVVDFWSEPGFRPE